MDSDFLEKAAGNVANGNHESTESAHKGKSVANHPDRNCVTVGVLGWQEL